MSHPVHFPTQLPLSGRGTFWQRMQMSLHPDKEAHVQDLQDRDQEQERDTSTPLRMVHRADVCWGVIHVRENDGAERAKLRRKTRSSQHGE